MREEIEAHIAIGVEHLVLRGVDRGEAEQRMRARFSDVPLIVASALRRSRDVERRDRIGEWMRDLRFACRQLRRSPGFAAAIVLSLGFGIGASATVFSWMEGLVLRPFPAVQGVDRLISVRPERRNGFGISIPELEDWRSRAHTVSELTAISLAFFAVRTQGAATAGAGYPVYGAYVSANYFDLLGVRAASGRVFRRDEDLVGAAPVAVISDALWRQQLGGSSDVVGQTIRANGYPVRVIGVAPPNFAGTVAGAKFDLWLPLSARPLLVPAEADRWRQRDFRWLDVIGRLTPGASVREAHAEFTALGRWQASEFAENRGRGAQATPLDIGTAKELEPLLLALVVITGLVILLICANVANLLLARAAARHRELAVRLAIGASRWALVRQLMVESTLLAGAGALIGSGIAASGQKLLGALTPTSSVTLGAQSGLDANFVVFIVAITTGAVLAFGLAPALIGSRLSLSDTLKYGARSIGVRNSRLRGWLVVAQFAFALSSLVCAALVLKRDRLVRAMDFGLREPESVLLVQMEQTTSGYADARVWERTVDLALARVAAVPGVRAATFASFVPLGFVGYARRPVSLSGRESDATARRSQPFGSVFDSNGSNRVLLSAVAPGYFALMRIPIRAGRAIDEDDRRGRQRVAVVNEAFASRYFERESPLGKMFVLDGDSLAIVGVAANGKYDYRTIDEPSEPLVYYAWKQAPHNFVTIHVRSAGDALALSSAVRAAILSVDPNIMLLAPVTLAEYASVPFFPSRSAVIVLSILSSAALLLASMGLFSVIAYGVAVRTREVGIRMALGASRSRVVGLFMGASVRLIAVGTATGVASAAIFTLTLRSQVTQLPRPDLDEFLVPAIVLALAAIAAGLIPSFRAASIDPANTLREE